MDNSLFLKYQVRYIWKIAAKSHKFSGDVGKVFICMSTRHLSEFVIIVCPLNITTYWLHCNRLQEPHKPQYFKLYLNQLQLAGGSSEYIYAAFTSLIVQRTVKLEYNTKAKLSHMEQWLTRPCCQKNRGIIFYKKFN